MSKQQHVILEATQPTISRATWVLILGIVLVAANQRAAITSVGPLIGNIRETTGLSNSLAGLLTTVPLLAFALLSPIAPKLSQRYTPERVVLVSLFVLLIGLISRSLSAEGPGMLFVGTLLIGLAISIFNVLIPSLVKRDFANNVGLMTGIYAVSMNLCGALASGISIPLARTVGLGWQGSLLCWCSLTVLAIFSWLPRLRSSQKKPWSTAQKMNEGKSFWRSGLAWQVTAFMGLQSIMFYMLVAWLPDILSSRGMSEDTSGWMLSLLQFSMLPFTLIVPIIASRMRDQRPLVFLTVVLFLIGISGLFMEDTSLVPLWIIIIGIAGACAFSLSMIFFSLRTKNSQEAAELSGMAQTIGYLLAAIGPLLFGLLHDLTHNWTVPLLLLLVATFFLLLAGIGAGRNKYV